MWIAARLVLLIGGGIAAGLILSGGRVVDRSSIRSAVDTQLQDWLDRVRRALGCGP